MVGQTGFRSLATGMATVQRPLGSTNQVRPVFSSETAIHPDPRTSLSQAAIWIPIVGDWDGNGTTTIGVYEPSTASFFLRNRNTPGPADITIAGGKLDSDRWRLGWQRHDDHWSIRTQHSQLLPAKQQYTRSRRHNNCRLWRGKQADRFRHACSSGS